MAASTTYQARTIGTTNLMSAARLGLAFALLVALTVPLLNAAPGPLSSDESLYVAEGMNIAAGKGFTYTTGEAVHHRGPLFPALLAADFTIAGVSVDNALWVPRLFALGSAALLLLLGWRLFGRDAGLLAGGLALVSTFLTLMGTSIFLDGVETFFLLLTLLCLHLGFERGQPRWAGLAGVSLGLAMLTKESALLWVPLPFVALLLAGDTVPRQREQLLAYGAGFVATAGWWWPYVFAVTGEVYLLGEPTRAALWLGVAALAAALPGLAVVSAARRGDSLRPGARWLLAGGVLIVWCAVFLTGLERHSTWSFPHDYLHNVPNYVTTILDDWLWPLPLVALAWCYAGYRAARGSRQDQLVVAGLLLYLPFALFIANRGLHLRDILLLLYLSYLVLARATIDAGRWLAGTLETRLSSGVAATLATVLVVAAFSWFTVEELTRFVDARAGFFTHSVRQDHWDNPLARETAVWIDEHVPPGTPVMSGRLYYSHLYTLTGGRYPWWQLPTVRVDFEGNPPALESASTLFRWEEDQLQDAAGAPWLYLRRYPIKGYYVALSERELLSRLREHDIGYVVVTGDDAGFSSLSLLPYFEAHPAFEKVVSFVADDENQTHILRVDPSRLQPMQPPARVSKETIEALRAKFGSTRAGELLTGLSPNGYVATEEYGVPPEDSAAP
ncbi:MAG: glycosyltransferase family 39 protein [Dehalococcoidia bacterium]